jgi:hypothetical protein
MSSDVADARADLAFIRAMVDDGASGMTRTLGETLLAGGLAYGLQCAVQGAPAIGLPILPPLWELIWGVGPTIVFAIIVAVIIWRRRHDAKGGFLGRAVGAAFACLSTSNIALICAIGYVAWRRQSLEIWLIYPCTVFVLQGAAWLIAYALRQRLWLLVVALGWYASAIAMAVALTISPALFGLVAGVALLLFMAVPGAVIVRLSGRPG